MKHMTRGILLLSVLFAMPVVYGQAPKGVGPQKAQDTKTASTTKAIVATSYSIKVEGTKRPVNQTLTSDKLLAGVDVPVEVGAGAKVRGQVLAGGLKKMVWIAAETGSHIPGHWVDADSKEAAARNTVRVSGDDFRNSMQRAPDPHQEGWPQMRWVHARREMSAQVRQIDHWVGRLFAFASRGWQT